MTFYSVLTKKYQGYNDWILIKNLAREDGRFEAATPDEAAQSAARQEARERSFAVPFAPGQYLAIPQHRFTQISVYDDGKVKRNSVNYAE